MGALQAIGSAKNGSQKSKTKLQVARANQSREIDAIFPHLTKVKYIKIARGALMASSLH